MDSVYEKLNFLTALCLSFLYFGSSIAYRRKFVPSSILGFSFFIPFCLYSLLFLYPDNIGRYIEIISHLTIIFFTILSFFIKYDKKSYSFTRFIIIIIPVSIFVTQNSLRNIYVSHNGNIPIIYLVAFVSSLAFLIYCYKANSGFALPAWSSILLSGYGILKLFNQSSSPLVYLLINVSAYSILALFFFREYSAKTVNQLNNYEKRISDLSTNLEREVRKRVFALERSNQRLVDISKKDKLTQTLNKDAILQEIKKNIMFEENNFTILIFDIDDFKEINDRYGHVDGDKCIKKVASTAKESIRDVDKMGRYGGDAFIIVLPDTNASEAVYIAERLKTNLSVTDDIGVTISIGIAAYPDDALSVEGLVKFADEGLYISKSKGKNSISHKNLF